MWTFLAKELHSKESKGTTRTRTTQVITRSLAVGRRQKHASLLCFSKKKIFGTGCWRVWGSLVHFSPRSYNYNCFQVCQELHSVKGILERVPRTLVERHLADWHLADTDGKKRDLSTDEMTRQLMTKRCVGELSVGEMFFGEMRRRGTVEWTKTALTIFDVSGRKNQFRRLSKIWSSFETR